MEGEVIVKLNKDLKALIPDMTQNEARILVDSFYQMQHNRVAAAQQVKSQEEAKQPHEVLKWAENNAKVTEKQLALALQKYAESQPMGVWAMQVFGIGPIIAAGLLAYIDIEKCPTVGHIWSFAGLDPTKKWEKGQKRPWNATLKVLAHKIGDCFMKNHNKPECAYGKLYEARKAYETAKNEAGDYADQAAAILKANPNHAQKAFYKKGILPPKHIDNRAQRYATKQFLSDWHAEAYRQHFGKEPPLPYPIAIMGHAHVRQAPVKSLVTEEGTEPQDKQAWYKRWVAEHVSKPSNVSRFHTMREIGDVATVIQQTV